MTRTMAILMRLFVLFVVILVVSLAHHTGHSVNYVVLIIGACLSFYFIGEQRRKRKRIENY